MAKKKPSAGPSILDALTDPAIFGQTFAGATWQAWRAYLATVFLVPMSAAMLQVYTACTGRTLPPTTPAREVWTIVSRRAGKSLMAAVIAVFLGCFRDYTAHLAPGERAIIMVIAVDRRQARVVFQYIAGLLDGSPLLAGRVESRTREAIHLKGRVSIEVHTTSFRSTRGYTLAGVVCDEIAFWRTEQSAAPDTEILTGLRPGLSTIPGALLVAISSGYARKGKLWRAHRDHYGREGDDVLVWQSDSRTMNPKIDPAMVARAYAEDPGAAAAEWGGQFRVDIESFVDPLLVQQLVQLGRTSQPPSIHVRQYMGFCDPAGGSGGDSMTLGVAHLDPRTNQLVLDLILERRPPFSPEAVTLEFADALKSYRVRKVVGDRFAGEWPAERFKTHGVYYEASEKTKSQIYSDLLPLLNSRAISLLDDRRLVSQLVGLERRTAWGGRDSVDHAPGGHDDVINAASGALLLAAAHRRGVSRPARVFGKPTVHDKIGRDSATGGPVAGIHTRTF